LAIQIYIGVREDGTAFRPSIWAEMLAGCACTVDASGMPTYSPYLYPVYTKKAKGICIDSRLEEENECAYVQALEFVTTNKLRLLK